MKNKSNNARKIKSRVIDAIKLLGCAFLIIFSFLLYVFYTGLINRDDLIAKTFLELIIKELFFLKFSPFVYLFASIYLSFIYMKTTIAGKKLFLVVFLISLTLSALLKFPNIARFTILNDVMSDYHIVIYEDDPGQPFDVLPSSSVRIENWEISDEELELEINKRIAEKEKYLERYGYYGNDKLYFYIWDRGEGKYSYLVFE